MIVRLPPTATSKGGIIVPEEAQYPGEEQEGFVVAVGPGRISKKGVRIPVEAEVGDRVLLRRYAGRMKAYFGKFDYFAIVEEDDILGVVE